MVTTILIVLSALMICASAWAIRDSSRSARRAEADMRRAAELGAQTADNLRRAAEYSRQATDAHERARVARLAMRKNTQP
ncbi:hypothetical protein ACFWXI_14560 [[Kitasatospora] papulosa]|uniref:hypothetical protein n=1 Tax=[Kitasatospora] papulosa TaxID=1464011 RepID=UPI0036C7C143